MCSSHLFAWLIIIIYPILPFLSLFLPSCYTSHHVSPPVYFGILCTSDTCTKAPHLHITCLPLLASRHKSLELSIHTQSLPTELSHQSLKLAFPPHQISNIPTTSSPRPKFGWIARHGWQIPKQASWKALSARERRERPGSGRGDCSSMAGGALSVQSLFMLALPCGAEKMERAGF